MNEPTMTDPIPLADPSEGEPTRKLDDTGPDRAYLVCGDCAAVFLAAGAVRSTTVLDIDLGHECDTHPKSPRPQASSAFEGTPKSVAALFAPKIETIPAVPTTPQGISAYDDDRAVSVHDRETSRGFEAAGVQAQTIYLPEEKLPTEAGPLTLIAAQLLSSWSTGVPANCDAIAVSAAVSFAKRLLLETKGS